MGVGIPGILRVVSARVIDARWLEEGAAFKGFRAKGKYICPGDARRGAVATAVGIVQSEGGSLLILAESF